MPTVFQGLAFIKNGEDAGIKLLILLKIIICNRAIIRLA